MSDVMSPLQVKTSVFVQQHLLKTSKLIRQLYAMSTDVDQKVKEWVLFTMQVYFVFIVCKMCSSSIYLAVIDKLFPLDANFK